MIFNFIYQVANRLFEHMFFLCQCNNHHLERSAINQPATWPRAAIAVAHLQTFALIEINYCVTDFSALVVHIISNSLFPFPTPLSHYRQSANRHRSPTSWMPLPSGTDATTQRKSPTKWPDPVRPREGFASTPTESTICSTRATPGSWCRSDLRTNRILMTDCLLIFYFFRFRPRMCFVMCIWLLACAAMS